MLFTTACVASQLLQMDCDVALCQAITVFERSAGFWDQTLAFVSISEQSARQGGVLTGLGSQSELWSSLPYVMYTGQYFHMTDYFLFVVVACGLIYDKL